MKNKVILAKSLFFIFTLWMRTQWLCIIFTFVIWLKCWKVPVRPATRSFFFFFFCWRASVYWLDPVQQTQLLQKQNKYSALEKCIKQTTTSAVSGLINAFLTIHLLLDTLQPFTARDHHYLYIYIKKYKCVSNDFRPWSLHLLNITLKFHFHAPV